MKKLFLSLFFLSHSLFASLFSCGAYSVFGEYLYWKPNQTAMTFGAADIDTTFLNEPFNLHQEFEWRSGFRIGARADFPCFDFSIFWTRFHPEITTTKRAPFILDTEILPLIDVFSLGEASSRWNLKFDMVDFQWGYPLFENPHFLFDPFFGAKVGWIRQNQRIEYPNLAGDPTLTGIVIKNSRFFGAGLKTGVHSLVHLGYGFSIKGNVEGSLLYGKDHAPWEYSATGIAETTYEFEEHRFIPNVALLLAFEWEYCSRWGKAILEVGYEMQLFLNTWRDGNYAVEPTSYVSDAGYGDLTFQGLTAGASLTF